MSTIAQYNGKSYKVSPAGTYYDIETPEAVINALESARQSGTRIRFWYGGPDGKSWGDEYDIIGTLGRSMGPVKIPLILRTPRSSGGPGVLENCIIRIMTTAGRELYRAHNFTLPAYAVIPSDLPEYAEAVTVDGELVARFKKPGSAGRWIQFMKGERFSK